MTKTWLMCERAETSPFISLRFRTPIFRYNNNTPYFLEYLKRAPKTLKVPKYTSQGTLLFYRETVTLYSSTPYHCLSLHPLKVGPTSESELTWILDHTSSTLVGTRRRRNLQEMPKQCVQVGRGSIVKSKKPLPGFRN